MSFKDVLRHIWSVHEARKCPICFIDTKNRTYYKEHLFTVHGEKLEKKVERPRCRKVLLVKKEKFIGRQIIISAKHEGFAIFSIDLRMTIRTGSTLCAKQASCNLGVQVP